MKILILGNKGMLGSVFDHYLSDLGRYEVIGADKNEVDITDKKALRIFFEKIKPDFVINCAAYTDVDGAEASREMAFAINGEAVKNIAELCKDLDTTLIHFSTDYVFDGKNPVGYKEEDEPNPINVYGESKLAGEKYIQEICEKYYIIRTAWLFGPNGKNFVATMLRLFSEKDELKVVNDQVGSPTFTCDLVPVVVSTFIDSVNPYGVYHITNKGETTWYGFACAIRNVIDSDVKILPISSEEFPRPAVRPKCSILINTKLDETFVSLIKNDWKEALEEYLADFV